MISGDYWKKRALQRLTGAEIIGDKYTKDILKVYDKAMRDINKQIDDVYRTYAKANKIDTQSLKELLTLRKSKELKDTLKEMGLENSPFLSNYDARLNRLEELQVNIYMRAKEIYGQENMMSSECYKQVINNSYLHGMYDTQIGTGLGFSFSSIDDNTLTSVLGANFQGKNFSNRIWDNTDVLAKELSNIVGAGIMSGIGQEAMVRQIRTRFDTNKYYAKRLVRTEVNHFNNEADNLTYKELNVEKYVFLATLDNRTSNICQDHDNKRYDVSKKESGVNFPPLHPNCRSTTRAFISEDVEKDLKRRARNPITGKNETVDNMNYAEWLKNQDITPPVKPKTKIDPKVDNKLEEKTLTLTEMSDKWYNDLTDKDKEYFEAYTSGNDMEVNRFNRIKNKDYVALDDNNKPITNLDNNYGIQGVKFYEDMTKSMDNAIDKFNLDRDITVYRTANDNGLRSVGIDNVNDVLYGGGGLEEIKSKLGDTIKDSGYMSTSLNIDEPFRLNSSADILYELKVPKGTKGAYIGSHSTIPDQSEFILGRNSIIDIEDITNELIEYTDDYGEKVEKSVIKIKGNVVNNADMLKTTVKNDIINTKPISFNIDDYKNDILQNSTYYSKDDVLKSMAKYGNDSNLLLEKQFKDKGYDKLSTKLKTLDYDNLSSNDYIKVKRGVKPTSSLNAQQMKDDFINGKLYVGRGNFGSGTYTAVNEEIAKSYGDTIIDIAIPKNANIVKIDDLLPVMKENRDKLDMFMDSDEFRVKYNGNLRLTIQKSLKDLSLYATRMNYDVIEVPVEHYKRLLRDVPKDPKPYYIILNRSKVIVKEL